MRDFFTIGKITGAHGIKGEVKVFPITDNVRRFCKLKECYLLKDDLGIPSDKDKLHELTSARIDRGNVLVRFDGMTDRTAAEQMKGLFVVIRRENATQPKKGSYFVTDLVDCKVVDDIHGEVGTVIDVLDNPSGSILSVKHSTGKEILIPFRKEFFYKVELENSMLYCRMPDGLLELYL